MTNEHSDKIDGYETSIKLPAIPPSRRRPITHVERIRQRGETRQVSQSSLPELRTTSSEKTTTKESNEVKIVNLNKMQRHTLFFSIWGCMTTIIDFYKECPIERLNIKLPPKKDTDKVEEHNIYEMLERYAIAFGVILRASNPRDNERVFLRLKDSHVRIGEVGRRDNYGKSVNLSIYKLLAICNLDTKTLSELNLEKFSTEEETKKQNFQEEFKKAIVRSTQAYIKWYLSKHKIIGSFYKQQNLIEKQKALVLQELYAKHHPDSTYAQRVLNERVKGESQRIL